MQVQVRFPNRICRVVPGLVFFTRIMRRPDGFGVFQKVRQNEVMVSTTCFFHRKSLLRFLLLKTAAVRRGVKPGELLRVRRCFTAETDTGDPVCLHRRDILNILELDYLELLVERDSSLVLFYHPETMARTLSEPENRALLL